MCLIQQDSSYVGQDNVKTVLAARKQLLRPDIIWGQGQFSAATCSLLSLPNVYDNSIHYLCVFAHICVRWPGCMSAMLRGWEVAVQCVLCYQNARSKLTAPSAQQP